jgi:hypothetical protein
MVRCHHWLTGVRLAAVTAASVNVFPLHKLILTTMQRLGRLRETSSTAELITPCYYQPKAQGNMKSGSRDCRVTVEAASHTASTALVLGARSVSLGESDQGADCLSCHSLQWACNKPGVVNGSCNVLCQSSFGFFHFGQKK